MFLNPPAMLRILASQRESRRKQVVLTFAPPRQLGRSASSLS